jgi:hypothetical protein
LQHALFLAASVAVPPSVRILPGVYPLSISWGTTTSAPLRIVATGATVAAQTAVQVTTGASMEIRGIHATGSQQVLSCDSSLSARSKLTLKDSSLVVGSNNANLVAVGKCDFSLIHSDIDLGGSSGSGLVLSSDASATVDRTLMRGGANPLSIGGFGTRITLKITNSILENVIEIWSTSDTSSPGSLIEMSFSTVHMDGDGWNCQPNSGSAFRTARYENNIFYSTNASSAINGADCTLSHNVLQPYTGSIGNNIAADPQFVNASARDYHLLATSPAIDVAVPSPSALATPDFDGTARPQGAQPDTGAFELKP